MTIKEIVSHIAKLEGKKHQASVGDVREIVSIISDMVYNRGKPPRCGDPVAHVLWLNGRRRNRPAP